MLSAHCAHGLAIYVFDIDDSGSFFVLSRGFLDNIGRVVTIHVLQALTQRFSDPKGIQ